MSHDFRLHICPDCLSSYKHFIGGSRRAKKIGAPWGRGMWPERLYHGLPTRKCQKHHVQSLADGGAYRAGVNEATPKWVDRNEIKKIYEEAMRLTRETGIPHEVDHIEPLNGAASRGLHVPWNLRAIPAHENRKKSNRLIV